ncbi:N-alpha-acetyltransferase 38, NatC auxiliary subunit [Diutina catenulata]
MGVERFIGANFRVFLTDDRILDGTLTVIDPFGNLLLNDVYETSRDRLNPSSDHVRSIGLVSVPRNTVSSVKVTKSTYKEISRGA